MKKLMLWISLSVVTLIIGACESDPNEPEQSAVVDCEAVEGDPTIPCTFPPLRPSTVFPTLIGQSADVPASNHTYDFDVDRAVMYEVNIRQYSEAGTFKAFEADLPRLQELGVDILWLMPIHPISETLRKGSLGSYYAISDYQAVNPEFGTMTDFEDLLSTAKELGFTVILDLVINHTGWDHPWITEHPEYYTQVDGEIIHPQGTDWTDVADLNHANEALVDELAEMTAFWIEKGVDGYRADVAGSVPNHVWEAVDDAVRAVNSDAFLLAEDNSRFDWFNIFNTNYGGWHLLHEMHQIAESNADETGLINYLNVTHDRYLSGSFPLLFTTNHDVNSWEGTHALRMGDLYPVMRMLTFTLPGMPLIYNGQEADQETSLAFFEKDVIAWGEYSHSEAIRSLIELRDANPALYATNTVQSTYILEDMNEHVFSFVRTTPDFSNQVLVVANLTGEVQSIELHLAGFRNHWTHQGNQTQLFNQVENLQIQPFEYRIYTRK